MFNIKQYVIMYMYIYITPVYYKYMYIVGALSFQYIPRLFVDIGYTCTCWIVEFAKVIKNFLAKEKLSQTYVLYTRNILIVSEFLGPLSVANRTFFRRFFLSHGLIQRLFIFTHMWGVGGKTPGIGENILS